MIFGEELDTRNVLDKRSFDTFKILNRKRNAHACIMSIVFIILYPLGAISIHLPIHRISFLRNTYLQQKIMAVHVPIQILGTVMMIGGTALGIKIGQDLLLLKNPVHAHVVIGLLVFAVIIVFQPIMGLLQHRHFQKTGGKSIFAYVHRWIGRGAILLGIVNNGLGFQLASDDIEVPKSSYIRNFIIAGILVFIWLGFIIYDEFGKQKSSATYEGGDKTFANGESELVNTEQTRV